VVGLDVGGRRNREVDVEDVVVEYPSRNHRGGAVGTENQLFLFIYFLSSEAQI
jgi:hypothetical protein